MTDHSHRQKTLDDMRRVLAACEAEFGTKAVQGTAFDEVLLRVVIAQRGPGFVREFMGEHNDGSTVEPAWAASFRRKLLGLVDDAAEDL